MDNLEKQILDKLQSARDEYIKRDFTKAIQEYSELAEQLKDDPVNYPVIQIELAWSYYHNQNFLETIRLLNSVLQSENLNMDQQFDCYRIIGFSHEMMGQVQKAIKFLQRSLEIDVAEDTKRYAYFELGKLLFTDGQVIEAEYFLNMANKLFQDSEKEYQTALAYYLGFVDFLQKRYRNARENFDFIIQNASDHKTKAGGYFGLCHIHHQEKDFTTLIDLCEKIIRLDSAFFDKETLGYFLCNAYLNLKNWDELEMYLKELKKNYPEGRYVTEYHKFENALKGRKSSKN
jgi:tetratricopeptide (TPR) repeat protein